MTTTLSGIAGRAIFLFYFCILIFNLISAQDLSGQYAGEILWVGQNNVLHGFIETDVVSSSGVSQFNYYATDNATIRAVTTYNRTVYYLSTLGLITTLNSVNIDTGVSSGLAIQTKIPPTGTRYGLTFMFSSVIACTDAAQQCFQFSTAGVTALPSSYAPLQYYVDAVGYMSGTGAEATTQFMGVTAQHNCTGFGIFEPGTIMITVPGANYTAVSYEPIKGYFFVYDVTNGTILQISFDTASGSGATYPVYKGIYNSSLPIKRILVTGLDQDRSTAFVAYESGNIDVFAIYGNYTTASSNLVTTFPFAASVEALASTPPIAQITSPRPELRGPTATFGSSPSFQLTHTVTSTSTSEVTTPVYGNFTTSGGVAFTWPAFWLRSQVLIPYPSGTSLDGLSVTTLSSINTSTTSYAWKAALFTGSSTVVQISTLNNPDAPLRVEGRFGITSQVAKGAVKFSLYMSGPDVAATLFNSNTSATIRWNTCFNNAQQIGSFALNYTTKTHTESIDYIFSRLNSNIASPIEISIATSAVIDNNAVVRISYKLTPAPYVDALGQLNICFEWEFPYFAQSLQYDPNLAVLVEPGNSDNGDGIDKWLIVEIVVPIVSVTSCICVACIIVVILIIIAANKLRLRRLLDKDSLVNFTELD